jgi:hypothetical protein
MTFKNFFNKFLLQEDSIEDIELKGDWDSNKQYGWNKADTGILKSPKGLERIKTKWKLDQPVDVYLVKDKNARKFVELGRVPFEFIRDKMGLDILPDSDHITIIYTQNTGAEKIPATPWTLAHRFGHALARVNGMGRSNDQYKSIEEAVNRLFQTVADEVYGTDISERGYYKPEVSQINSKIRRELGHALGTFKSARDRRLRADFEFVNEIIAQYIITGKVKLNREFPKVLPLRYTWGQPSGKWRKKLSEEDNADLGNYISNMERELEYHIDDALNAAIGDIFVM